MSRIDQLAADLGKLSADELEQVLSRATGVRGEESGPDAKRGFAVWLAKQHLGLDPHLAEVIYLPAGAPDPEVRLLEVNTKLAPDPGNDAIIPLVMTPAVSNLPYRVLAADLTPGQWEQVQKNPALLPNGWVLADRVRVGRRRG